MANPVSITLAAVDIWEKVASSVTTGWIYAVDNEPNYFYTYRLAGDTAPTGTVADELPFEGSGQAEINSSEPIDVYVKSKGSAGTVVVAI